MITRGGLRSALCLLGAAAVMAAPASAFGGESPLAPPSNDDCAGAIPIPSDSFPYLTEPVNLIEAGAVGEPALCSTSPSTVWYTFTPSETGLYEFTTCPGLAPATNLYSTVLSVMTAANCGDVFTTVQCNFRDALCGEEFWQPRVVAELTGGTLYYVVAGAIASPYAGRETVQIRVSHALPPPNDVCASASPMVMNVPSPGSFAAAKNDYTLPNGSVCFELPAGPPAPVGQTFSTAPGRDVVFAFKPDGTGTYSFRVEPFGRECCSNMVLFVSTACESGASPEPVESCIGAASRSPGSANWYGTEEVVCVPLVGGQTYYAFVDETFNYTYPSQFHLTVSPCAREAEPNDSPAGAATASSGVVGATGTGGDFDYFSLGALPAGTRVFAMADQAAGNTRAIQMRVTNAISTLEFDDNDNAVLWGDVSPNIAGCALDGTHSYVQVSPNSTTTLSEPYRLTYVLQPPGTGYGGTSASPNSGSNSPPHYNVAANLFFSGEIAPSGDVDPFTFCAHAGDEIFASLDNDPLRDNTPFDGSLTVWNTHGIGIGFGDANVVSDSTPGSGSLTSVTPHSPADAMTWKARQTGLHRVNVYSTVAGAGATGDYLLSIAINGQIGADQSVDLAASTSEVPDPVATGSVLTYQVTVTNAGPNIAQMATWTNPLPSGVTFLGLDWTATGGAWTCAVPDVGSHGTIQCENPCFEDGGTATFTIRVRLDYCIGDGALLTNTSSVTSLTAETDGSDNTSSNQTRVSDDGSCDDASVCTLSEACNGTVCEASSWLDCSDGQLCTTDSCDPLLGCQNVPIPLPAPVNDSLRVEKVGTDAVLSWSDPPGPFNVYRGSFSFPGAWQYNHSCVAPATEGPYTDPQTPREQQLFYYLVSRENACGQESAVGHDSQGTPDPNPFPCGDADGDGGGAPSRFIRD